MIIYDIYPGELLEELHKFEDTINSNLEMQEQFSDLVAMLADEKTENQGKRLLKQICDLYPYGGKMTLLVLTHLTKVTEEIYKKHGIGNNILKDSLSDLLIYAEDYFTQTGEWGLWPDIYWIFKNIKGRMIRLGRLQYNR